MTMYLKLGHSGEVPVDTALFWEILRDLVRAITPEGAAKKHLQATESLRQDVEERPQDDQVLFYHRSPIEVLQLVLDRPLSESELEAAARIQQKWLTEKAYAGTVQGITDPSEA